MAINMLAKAAGYTKAYNILEAWRAARSTIPIACSTACA